MNTCDASALDLSQAQLGAGRWYSRSAFRSIWTVHCFPFHFQDEISAQTPVRFLHWIWQCLVSVTASWRSRKISWSQNKKIKPHFKYLFCFWRSLHWLAVSFKLGKFWKRVRLLDTFLQPSSYILHSVADRFCSTLHWWLQSALNYILCNLPESRDFLQQSEVPCVLVKSQVGGSSHTESCSKHLEENIFWREIKISIFQGKGWFCVFIVIPKVC